MTATPIKPYPFVVLDSIHGDIRFSELEKKVIDTATFQRLRHLKQLQMGHFTYPNATHTRFAHSLGTLGIMSRVIAINKNENVIQLGDRQEEDLRLAALLHDIGHYPYSHLMEKIDKVKLTEEELANKGSIGSPASYPRHEQLGRQIVTEQSDILNVIGGIDRAESIADLFTRSKAADSQLSKLLHSSFDLDRLDYLLRDAKATGVPFGQVDIIYLLNNLLVSQTGMLGVKLEALAAAEHFLLARTFMYRSVYYHKTTFGMEEACRQLLRRIRDSEEARERYGLPLDGQEIKKIVRERLSEFTDVFVDRIILLATQDENRTVRALARAIHLRNPPKLLKEVQVLIEKEKSKQPHRGTLFYKMCKEKLPALAAKYNLDQGRFMLCKVPPIVFEKRGPTPPADEAEPLEDESQEELIKVFIDPEREPEAIVDVEQSIIRVCAKHYFQIYRLYVVADTDLSMEQVASMKRDVSSWDKG